jgi:hypothetical protein
MAFITQRGYRKVYTMQALKNAHHQTQNSPKRKTHVQFTPAQ